MLPPIYKTPNYLLQAYEEDHEERFVEMGLDEYSVHFMGGSNGIEEEERELFKRIQLFYPKNVKKWHWIWAICQELPNTKETRLCAHLELKETDNTEKGELEIVYMVHPDARRKGLMKEILAFLKEKQTEWDRRIIATVSPENKASLALLETWGIEKKETFYDEEEKKNSFKLILNKT